MSIYNNNYQQTVKLQEYELMKKGPDIQPPIDSRGFQQLDEDPHKEQNIVQNQSLHQERIINQNVNQQQQWQNIDQIQQPQPQQLVQVHKKQIENKNKYEKHIKKDGETSQMRLHAKLNYIFDGIEQGDQNLTVSYCSQSDLTKSNLLSESSSIYSNKRSWRELNANRANNTNKIGSKNKNNKINSNIQSLGLLRKNENKLSMPTMKYLFYEQPKKQVAEGDKNKQIQIIKTPKKQKQANKRQNKQQMVVLLQQNIHYDYKKGKKIRNQTKQERVKSKIGFILDCLQDKNQIASVSYFSESQLSELPQKQNQPQFTDIENRVKHQQPIQQRVIFAEQPHQLSPRQHQVQIVSKLQMKSQTQKIVLQQKNQASQQRPIQKSQQLTPKQTIDLDKSFKSKNTKKSTIMMKSLDKSRVSKIHSNNTPITPKRRDSFEQMQQIIAQIQRKSQQFKKAVSQSVLSKNSNLNDLLQQNAMKSPKKLSTKSAVNKSIQQQNKFFQDQQRQKVNQPSRYAQKKSISRKSQNKSASSNPSVKVEQVELKMTPTYSSLLKKQQENQQSISSAGKKSSQPYQTQQSPQKIGKKEEFQKQENQNTITEFRNDKLQIKKDSQSSFAQSLRTKDKPIFKQLRQPLKKVKPSYLKTLQKQEIDQAQLISEFVPKNKVQFKVDSRKRLKSQLSQKPVENKKFLALLKRREEAIVKKSNQQHQINPRMFIFPEQSSGMSKQSSMRSNQQSVTEALKLSPIPLKIGVRDSSKNKIHIGQTIKKNDFNNSNYGSLLPTLNSHSLRIKQASKTFYAQNQGSKKKNTNNINTERKLQKSDSQYSDIQRQFFDKQTNQFNSRFLIKPASNKVEYLNLAKQSKLQKSPIKNSGAKQKYQRLKKLLGDS